MPERSFISNSSLRDGACSILMANDDVLYEGSVQRNLLNVGESCLYYSSELGEE